ncbi:MAG TPA: efflux RND transporter periplasmic adaptor subunit [Opitutaceae bacterium]|nr:efflux RND transporter periplasmic adaptor subunit [Opitutaceae bacterium]
MKRRRPLVITFLVLGAVTLYFVTSCHPRSLVLTGIVTTDDVIVSSEIQGRLQQLSVKQGDAVKSGQLLGLIAPEEWKADMAYYENGELGAAADLKYEQAATDSQIKQAEANLASAEAQAAQAEADLENAQLNFKRAADLHQDSTNSQQEYDQARTACDSAKAHADAQHQQVQSAQAAVELAQANATQVATRRAALAAAAAQKDKAQVQLGYTEIHAPIDGVVDVRAALEGEVVNPGQAIVTLVNPDDLWVRADVEESYIERIHLGDKMTVRLPSGVEREGTVFFRGVDADYATQRDVSRTKRDIKTFEVRLRCDNSDRSLAVGMTAYVLMPLDGK